MKKILITVITLAMIISLCSCSSDSSRIDELEKRVEVLENAVGISGNEIENNEDVNANNTDNTKNEEYREAKAIHLYCQFNTKDETWEGPYYELRLNDKEGTCTFNYHDENGEVLTSDYSEDVYKEVLDMICSQDLVEYQKKTDSSGKILDDVKPYMLGIHRARFIYFEEPSNMSEIVAKFESFKDQAEPAEY